MRFALFVAKHFSSHDQFWTIAKEVGLLTIVTDEEGWL